MSYASICSFIKMATLTTPPPTLYKVPDPFAWSICRRCMSAAAVFNLRPNLNTGKSHKAFPQCNVRTARCIRINGCHFVLTHTQTHLHVTVYVRVCVCDICIKYKHYYLCFAIDSCWYFRCLSWWCWYCYCCPTVHVGIHVHVPVVTLNKLLT